MPKISKAEKIFFLSKLVPLEQVGYIKNLKEQPVFFLRGEGGKAIAKFTPDYSFTVVKSVFDLSPDTKVIMEYKANKDMWAYKRADYAIFKRWLIADNPDIVFLECIGGNIEKPLVRYPREKKC